VLQATLSEDRLNELQESGTAMSLDDAITYALSD
jgi:hypothetical protein